MDVVRAENSIILRQPADFSPELIFECGQCFRWNEDEGGWIGVAHGKALRLRKLRNGDIELFCSESDFNNIWYNYFDLSTDYSSIRAVVSNCEYMNSAVEYGTGIRILRQDRWEALCSFIISQCNNISRIKKIIETFCRLFGEAIDCNGTRLYTFPDPSVIAVLEPNELASIKSGYRASYIINAAQEIDSGRLDLDELATLPSGAALERLIAMQGVGKKVANCVLLFGLNKTDAFPVDVWMKRALEENFPPDFDPAAFGGYAGIAQQYIFHYARTAKKLDV